MLTHAAQDAVEVKALVNSVQQALRDVQEYTEDPRPFARELFAKQKTMAQIKEFDANGFRVPSKP